jgi:L-alanine-DL-glutamate epimerase-like enolase superfamily enzyme
MKSIKCFELRIPFTRVFKHGSAERDTTETLLVEITDEDGHVSYGEGCPRSYVTGETIKSSVDFIKKNYAEILEIDNLEALKDYISNFVEDIDQNPAAWCPVELALLDLMASREGISVESLLGKTATRDSYKYSAIIGDSSPKTFRSLFEDYRHLGFTDFKIKLSNSIRKDREKLQCMKEDLDLITVRADANNLWDSSKAAIDYLNDLDFRFIAIEEPVRSKDFAELQAISYKTGYKMILDESLTNQNQISVLKEHPSTWIVNARVSKYGGVLRSLMIIEELLNNNIDIIVGAHVGETSLLTRVGLILADYAGDRLRAQEGAFSTHLLSHDVFEPNLIFGSKGLLDKSLLECRDKPGFGVNFAGDFEKRPEIIPLNIH